MADEDVSRREEREDMFFELVCRKDFLLWSLRSFSLWQLDTVVVSSAFGESSVSSVSAGRVYHFVLLEGRSDHVREELCVPGFTCVSVACSTTSEYVFGFLYLWRRGGILLSILRVRIIGCWLAHDDDALVDGSVGLRSTEMLYKGPFI